MVAYKSEILKFLFILILAGTLLGSICYIRFIISNWRIKRIAKIMQVEFQPGKCIFLFFNKSIEIFGMWNNYHIRAREYMHSKSHGMTASLFTLNPSKSKLELRFKTIWEKKHNYFGNKWDNVFLVTSKPVAFGKHVLDNDEVFRQIIKAQSIYWLFIMKIIPGGCLLSIARNGEIKIWSQEVHLTEKRVLKLLESAKSIAPSVEKYSA